MLNIDEILVGFSCDQTDCNRLIRLVPSNDGIYLKNSIYMY